MIDWHSHILPGIDDGSKDVAESVALIGIQAEQGVSKIIATPHFYANDESVETFLQRRNEAFAQLQQALPAGSPEILCGAEVRYYHGISHMEELKALRIAGTKLLLLEMPMSRWTEFMIRDLIELSGVSGVQVVLAHVDRYWNLQKTKTWLRLLESGILMQINANFVINLGSRRKAISLLQKGWIQLLGSDCHNLTTRPPKLAKAFEIMQKKLGEEFLSQMHEYGCSLLAQ